MNENKINLNPRTLYDVLKGSSALKRSPAGGRSKISKITEICPHEISKIEIISPFNRAILDVEGELKENILVDALAIEKACLALIKSKKISLSFRNEELNLSGLSEINIPLKKWMIL